MNSIEAVILAGGEGTRLREVVKDRPKPMASVGGRPFLEWLVRSLCVQGVRRIVLCTGYMSEAIEKHFGDGDKWDVKIVYSRDPVPLGTGGALRQALHLIGSDRFVAMNGDSYCRVDIWRLEATHRARQACATLWLVPVDDCTRYGAVEVAENGAIQAFREKSLAQHPGWINAGVYLLQRETLLSIPPGCSFSMEMDFFPRLISQGLYAVRGSGPFVDIGTPESYKRAEQVLREDLHIYD